jgi:hypothetical protein
VNGERAGGMKWLVTNGTFSLSVGKTHNKKYTMITAKEANKLTIEQRTIDRENVYKRIKESAMRGNFSLDYSLPFPTPLELNKFVSDLILQVMSHPFVTERLMIFW